VTSVADRLRELADRLPTGGSLTLTRDALLELAAVENGQVEAVAAADLNVAELAARSAVARAPSATGVSGGTSMAPTSSTVAIGGSRRRRWTPSLLGSVDNLRSRSLDSARGARSGPPSDCALWLA